MLKILILAMLISTSFATDFGLPVDKVSHFLVGNQITRVAEEKLEQDELGSFTMVLFIACYKELIDVSLGGSLDYFDILATVGGWGLERVLYE